MEDMGQLLNAYPLIKDGLLFLVGLIIGSSAGIGALVFILSGNLD
jgi:hypothetical protein